MEPRRGATLFVALILVIAACGGSSSEPESTPVTTVVDSPTESDPVVTTSSAAEASEGEGSGGTNQAPTSGLGIASVTIEGETYHFGDTGIAIQCTPDFFGVMMVALQMVDENGDAVTDGGGFGAALLHEGTDPAVVGQVNSLRLKLQSLDKVWIANEEDIVALGLDPGSSQVDSLVIDGNTASGTATVYELNSYYRVQGGNADSVDVAQATFEINCANQ
jgi:hypothetical protein